MISFADEVLRIERLGKNITSLLTRIDFGKDNGIIGEMFQEPSIFHGDRRLRRLYACALEKLSRRVAGRM